MVASLPSVVASLTQTHHCFTHTLCLNIVSKLNFFFSSVCINLHYRIGCRSLQGARQGGQTRRESSVCTSVLFLCKAHIVGVSPPFALVSTVQVLLLLAA
ncbi:hypothetical protein ATANTOWER_019075 [Ataeniobius toweri]|uniref:Uncharacterized protein n=1 Tax=Ataeniobius toweri TaxID=208326 RepID=A0ABU7AJK4_9TELE|nr:hypothetical protein [Ataeniobius toweri]